MKKWIFIGLGTVAVIVAVVVFLGLSNLGPIIKKAVNTYGPGITKTEVHVADVNVSIFSAEAKINDFFLGNPKGFKTPSAVRVDSVFVNVNEKTLVDNPIIIDQIKVKSPEISYEKKGKIDNFQSILNNVNKTTAFEKSSTTSSKDKGPGKKLIVRDFIVTDGKVNVSLEIYGLGQKEIIVSLPDIHLKDIGKEKNGLSAAEVSKQIVTALYEKITSNAVTNAINQELKAYGANLDSLGKTAMKQVEGASEKVKDLEEKVKGLLNN